METAKTKLESSSIPRQTLVSFVRDLFGGYPNPDDPHLPGRWDPVIRRAIKKMPYTYDPLGLGNPPNGSAYALDPLGLGKPPKNRAAGSYPHIPPPEIDREKFPPVLRPLPDPWETGFVFPWRDIFHIIAQRHPAIWDIIGGGPLSMVALNPQPLPPGILFAASVAAELINDAVARQELADLLRPNGEEAGIIIVGGRVDQFVDDWCGTMWKLRWPFPGPKPNWWKEELNGTDLVVMGVQFENATGQVFNKALSQTFTDAGTKFIETSLSRL